MKREYLFRKGTEKINNIKKLNKFRIIKYYQKICEDHYTNLIFNYFNFMLKENLNVIHIYK